MDERESKIINAIKELIKSKDNDATAEIKAEVGEDFCNVQIDTNADITIGEIVPIAGRYTKLQIRPKVVINKI